MLRIENEYFTLYKSVDAICRDMFREERHFNGKGEEVFGVSAYIRIMVKRILRSAAFSRNGKIIIGH